MTDTLKVDFAEIDRVAEGLTSLNAWAGPLVPKVGALVGDLDLLASAILSPGTAVTAEGAIVRASAGLSVTIVSTETITLITVSVVKTYEAAERALEASALALRVVVAAADYKLGQLKVVMDTLPADLEQLGGVAGKSWAMAWAEATVNGIASSCAGEGPVDAMRSWVDGFWDGTADGLQWGLGELGPDYGGVLDRLIFDAQVFGAFEDGDAHRVRPGGDLALELGRRAEATHDQSMLNTGERVSTDSSGRVLPRNASEIFQSAAQIDGIGGNDLADIRVLTKKMPDGSFRFTLQIPSTLSWSPWAANHPNDLTSDVVALSAESTALSRAGFSALRQAMADAGAPTDSPVMVAGFSLGGITAASMASNPEGFNVKQIVTAGSPIGNFDVPATTRVHSLEAHGDPIAALDGVANPVGANWTTDFGEPARLATEDSSVVPSPIERHNADRYSVMVRSSADDDAGINSFLNGGNVTVQDFFYER